MRVTNNGFAVARLLALQSSVDPQLLFDA